MKSLKYYPFERNRYFYGKLLSVDDFETEQKYVNNKRRMINRFIHGTGVVCGMNVIAVDDSTISIERGFALDFSGREIIIDTPVTKKLSVIDGFDHYDDQEQNNFVYLCVEYSENEKEPVHSITNSKTKGADGVEYNKYAEGYHIYLSNLEPEKEDFTVNSYYEETKTIYWGNGIRIKQIVPNFVESNAPFEIKIVVENMGQPRPFSFQYELDLTCIQALGKGNAKVTFDESTQEKASRYEFTYPLKTTAVKEIEGKLGISEGSFNLICGGKKMKAQAKGSFSTRIIGGNVLEQIIENYYHTAMEDISKNNYQQGIYLAKIGVIKAGSTYVIDSVEPMPFDQYIFSNSLAAIVNNLYRRQEGDSGKKEAFHGMTKGNNAIVSEVKETGTQVATGTAILDLGIGGVLGQKFFTKDIVHGLGLGSISIILGEAVGLGDEGDVIFGSQQVFEEKNTLVKAELAAKVNVMKGTFVIGLKCLEPTALRQVKVHWIAVKDSRRTVYEREQKTLNIKPDILNLSICETYYFEALLNGATESRVSWQVKEEGGGTIDENGMYTAPNKVGVFEVIAQSMDYPEMKASTFVVVRDV